MRGVLATAYMKLQTLAVSAGADRASASCAYPSTGEHLKSVDGRPLAWRLNAQRRRTPHVLSQLFIAMTPMTNARKYRGAHSCTPSASHKRRPPEVLQ